MFIIVSYNLKGTRDQRIHCMTDNYDKAVQMYNFITIDDGNEKSRYCVELLLISENYENIKGHQFYYRSADKNIKVLRSTNGGI